MLPSPAVLRRVTEAVGLATEGAFDTAWPRLASLGVDERFRRPWKYHLAYCEPGFRTGSIGVGQIKLWPG